MSEMGRDAARAAERAGEVAQQVFAGIDKVYVAAKAEDWTQLLALIGLIFAGFVVWHFVQAIIEANKNRPKATAGTSRPTFGSSEYFDWANREGRFAPPRSKEVSKKIAPPTRPLPLP